MAWLSLGGLVTAAAVLLGLLVLLVLAALGLTLATFLRIYWSVQAVPPLSAQECRELDIPEYVANSGAVGHGVGPWPGELKAQQETMEARYSPLLRYLPEIRGKLAWAPLGSFPTPIHLCELPVPMTDPETGRGYTRTVRFFAKREDLSSSRYGGNKVRTLEHQLPCAVADLGRRQLDRVRRGLVQKDPENRFGASRIYVIGAPGSNQCVASAAHSGLTHAPVCSFWLTDETASRDNGLNLWSVLSFPFPYLPMFTVPNPVDRLGRLMKLVWHIVNNNPDKEHHKILCLGGANVTGALGHVGGALELAHQIEQGLLPEPRHLFLPLGSGCTTAGLLCGIAVARVLGVGFKRPMNEMVILHTVVIHHILAAMPFATKLLVRNLASDTAKAIFEMSGVDARKETLMMFQRADFICSKAGTYGGHTAESLHAKGVFARCQLMETQPSGESFLTGASTASPETSGSSRVIAEALRDAPHVTGEAAQIVTDSRDEAVHATEYRAKQPSEAWAGRRPSDITKQQMYSEDTDTGAIKTHTAADTRRRQHSASSLPDSPRVLEQPPSALPRPWLDSTFAGKCCGFLLEEMGKRIAREQRHEDPEEAEGKQQRKAEANGETTGTEASPAAATHRRGSSGETEPRQRRGRRSGSVESPTPPANADWTKTEAGMDHPAGVLDCPDVLLWSTKSLVQPNGELSEARTRQRLVEESPAMLSEWFRECWEVEGIVNEQASLAATMVDVRGRW